MLFCQGRRGSQALILKGVTGLGLLVSVFGLELRVSRLPGCRIRVYGLGFRVRGLGFGV